MSTPAPAAKTTYNANLSRPADCQEMKEEKKERTAVPVSAGVPTSIRGPAHYCLLIIIW